MRYLIAFLMLILAVSCGSSYEGSAISPRVDSVYCDRLQRTEQFRPPSFNENGKQFYLCKVFGFLYYHQIYKSKGDVAELLEEYVGKIKLTGKEQYDNLIEEFIRKVYPDSLFDGTRISVSVPQCFSLTNNSWLQDTIFLNTKITNALKNIQAHYYKRVEKARVKVSNIEQNTIGLLTYNEPYLSQTGSLPDENNRLIGLYHYWNFINYHYVYKNLTDKCWDDVLYSAIPLFLDARDEIKYKKAILELIAELGDSHSITDPKIVTSVFGDKIPNFRVAKIGDTFIVKSFRARTFPVSANIGDIILAINGKPIEEIDSDLSKYAAGSNTEAKQRNLNGLLFCSFNNSSVYTVNRNGSILTLKAPLFNYKDLNKAEWKEKNNNKKRIAVDWLKDSIAYIHLRNLYDDNVEKTLIASKKSKAIILDMRAYPNDEVEVSLINFIVKENEISHILLYPDIIYPGVIRFQRQRIPIKIDTMCYKYPGRVVLLVDEGTQSKAEFVAMALQLNKKVYTIGNTTAGADGNVTSFRFPGGIEVALTNLGILYPDWCQTQRVGIRIDKHVKNNTRSIIEQRDFMLTNAIYELNNTKNARQN